MPRHDRAYGHPVPTRKSSGGKRTRLGKRSSPPRPKRGAAAERRKHGG